MVTAMSHAPVAMKHKGCIETNRKATGKHTIGTSLRCTKSVLARNFVQAMSTQGQIQVMSKKVNLENLDQLWRPFLVWTRALGLFPFVSENIYRKISWWRNPWNLYTVVSLCGCILQLIVIIKRKAVNGLAISVMDFNDYTQAAYISHVLVSTSSLIYFLNSKTFLDDLFQTWSSLRFEQVTTSKLNVLMKRKIKCALSLWAFNTVCTVIAYGFWLYTVIQSDFNIQAFVLTLVSFWYEIACSAQIGLFVTLCWSTTCLLRGICCDLEAELADGSSDVNLKWFKNTYMTVVHFIDVSNQFFGIYVGVLLISTIIQACCNTYTFFSYGYNDVLFAPMLFWLVESWSIIILVCLSAGDVCEQAGHLYRILLKMDVLGLPICKQIQAMMTLDCFRNLEAKIAMFGFIPITKQTLPTLISVYLSYVFLLYQFPQGSK